MSEEYSQVFAVLRGILQDYEPVTVLRKDSATDYYLDMPHIMKNKRPLFFSATHIGKTYVSFHFMPVYGSAQLRDDLSPLLRSRMQGKACFNFRRVDEIPVEELTSLVRSGFELFDKTKHRY